MKVVKEAAATVAVVAGWGGPGLFDASVGRKEEDQQSGKRKDRTESGEGQGSDLDPFFHLSSFHSISYVFALDSTPKRHPPLPRLHD